MEHDSDNLLPEGRLIAQPEVYRVLIIRGQQSVSEICKISVAEKIDGTGGSLGNLCV